MPGPPITHHGLKSTSNGGERYSFEGGKVNLSAALHPLNEDEERTCESIVKGCRLSVIAPVATHHIDEHGRLTGFAFQCPSDSSISALPLSRTTFFGHTACECNATSADIIRLLSDVDAQRRIMADFIIGVRERTKHKQVATLACRPGE